MLIDFNTMEEKELEHFKGGEKSFHAKMFTDDSNKIMRGRLERVLPSDCIPTRETTR